MAMKREHPAAPPVKTVRFGAVLRERRRLARMTLDALAARTGMTKGFLSEVERDLASPSVASLVSLCDALGLSVGSLFEAHAPSAVVRVADRAPIRFGGAGLTDHLLSPKSAKRLQVILSAMEPSGTGGAELYAIPAEEEFVLVLEGRCDIRLEDATIRLEMGDAFTFDPKRLHTFANPSDSEPALVLYVVTPSQY